ncbi:MAG: NADPH-dependent reductase family protein [Microvirga sp.]|jgi:FMN-dependent NADH-azoreductase|nr:NADPH-dependent reductase family protein [Microvirga sp.]
MSTVLVLNSSLSGEASVSRQLVQEALSNLRAQDSSLEVITRDVGSDPLPHLTGNALQGLADDEPDAAQSKIRALADELIAEIQAAQTIIIGAPMYNFGIPSTLKAWFDYVLRAGTTFRYTENGPEGLLTGKRAIVVESRGGFYSDGPAKALDGQEPHLRALLGFVGITDVTFVRAERLAMGPEIREQAIQDASSEVRRVTDDALLRAA